MQRRMFAIGGIAITAIFTATVLWCHATPGTKASTTLPSRDWIVAGAGRIEPESEDIKLGAELTGKLKAVYVEESDRVTKGELLAELENAEYRAQVDSARAELEQREAELRKVVNGARREERREAYSSMEEAQAVMLNAGREMERRKQLFAAGVVSREEADQYAKEYDVALAKYNEMAEHNQLVDAAAREEDEAIARANVAAARAKLEQAEALYAKTFVRSPIDAVVLRKHHRVGESVSNGSTVPDPIITLGETERLRVRVDVDEADVNKIVLGQHAYVTAEAYGGQKFSGHIIRIGEELGRKNIRTDEPTERVDMKILETLIELDNPSRLPIGLRVNAFILPQT